MRSEDRLREMLSSAPVPGAPDAEARGLPVVLAAFEARQPARRSPAPRLVLALAAALTLAAALLLSPAGASVRGWVGDVFSTATPAPAPALTEIPGGGRLLVQSDAGTWVVQADGSRRLIGRYEEASWSRPLGLFVAAADGRGLSAIEPDGTVRWSLSAPGPVSDPRWSPSGFRIAYRSGEALRVADADGQRDRPLAPRVAPVAPAWFGPGLHYLALVDAGRRLRIVDADQGETLASAPALPGVEEIGWSPDGSTLLEASPHELRLRSVQTSKLAGSIGLGAPRTVPLPADARLESAAFSSRSSALALVLSLPGAGGRQARSEVALLAPGAARPHRLLSVPGSLSAAVWSPEGDRLLIPWPALDEWLFIPVGGGRGRAFGPISPEFAPGTGGAGAGFPEVEGWARSSRAAAPQG